MNEHTGKQLHDVNTKATATRRGKEKQKKSETERENSKIQNRIFLRESERVRGGLTGEGGINTHTHTLNVIKKKIRGTGFKQRVSVLL